MEDGIAYRNAEWFLKSLPEITLEIGLEMSDLEQEEQEEEHELEQGPIFLCRTAPGVNVEFAG